MMCDRHNCGTVVAAHSNQQRDGKGIGHKAADYRVAFLCYDCHMEIDQRNRMTRTEKLEQWEAAHRKTIGWLFDNGYLDVRRE
jgi:hypothetical protein